MSLLPNITFGPLPIGVTLPMYLKISEFCLATLFPYFGMPTCVPDSQSKKHERRATNRYIPGLCNLTEY